MVGHLGAAPSVSPIRTARIAVFLVPDMNVCVLRGINVVIFATLPMSNWKSLLIVYRRIDVRIPVGGSRENRFAYELTDDELADALNSFRAFPPLAEDLSGGAATVTYEIAVAGEPLTSVTPSGDNLFWPSPDDTRKEIDTFAPPGRYNSVFILWPGTDFVSGASVPCPGWGLGMEPSAWSNDATYAVVGNALSWAWNIPVVGEVWLHEWLHGVCRIFAQMGVAMPVGDADAGGSHGYVQSKITGWTDFYRDLMTGQVLEDGMRKGITPEAWRSWPPG